MQALFSLWETSIETPSPRKAKHVQCRRRNRSGEGNWLACGHFTCEWQSQGGVPLYSSAPVVNDIATELTFIHLCFPPCQDPLLWGHILSSPSSPGSPLWSLNSSQQPPAPMCCQPSPPHGLEAQRRLPARPLPAASRRQSSPCLG